MANKIKPASEVSHKGYTKKQKERRAENEPKYTGLDTAPPGELYGVALEHWHEMMTLFKEGRKTYVFNADRRMIQTACESWAEKTYYDVEIENVRGLIRTATGLELKNLLAQEKQYCGIREKAKANFISAYDKLGLTPTSRARIGKNNMDNEDDDENSGFF